MNCSDADRRLTRRTSFMRLSLRRMVVQEGPRRLRALPTTQTDRDDVRRVCKRPPCGRVVVAPSGRSRPREFCSDTCRLMYQRERKKVASALIEAQRLAVQYEVDTAESRAHSRGFL